MKEFDTVENPRTAAEIRADAYDNLKKAEQIKQLIPETVTVSMFLVNCKDIRNAYAAKFE
jgi:hypothetical protein